MNSYWDLYGSAGTAGRYPVDALLPGVPDFATCHERYGKAISLLDCIYALDSLPSANDQIAYFLNRPNHYSAMDGNTMFALPQERRHGTCTITLRLTPSTMPTTGVSPHLPLYRPANLWKAAAGVVKKCIDDNGRRIGGFTTFGFTGAIDYIHSLNRHGSAASFRDPFPFHAYFLTISVTGPGRLIDNPGDYDPMIPLKLYESQGDINGRLPPSNTSPLSRVYLAMVLGIGDLPQPWWNLLPTYASQAMSSADEMTYQCDANLGAPTEVDCTHLEYSQFGSPSDTVAIDANRPKKLSLNTCDLSISSSTSISLTWAQIGAALNALIGICITSPLVGSAKGGRAFYGSQAFSLVGKTRRKRGKQTASGLNALPPGVNITLSKHGHGP